MSEPTTEAEIREIYRGARTRLYSGRFKDEYIPRQLDADMLYEVSDYVENKHSSSHSSTPRVNRPPHRGYGALKLFAEQQKAFESLAGNQIQAILRAVAIYSRINLQDLLCSNAAGNDRKKVRALRLAIALLSKHIPGLGITAIGRAVNRHHATILYNIRVLNKKYPKRDVEAVERFLGIAGERGTQT